MSWRKNVLVPFISKLSLPSAQQQPSQHNYQAASPHLVDSIFTQLVQLLGEEELATKKLVHVADLKKSLVSHASCTNELLICFLIPKPISKVYLGTIFAQQHDDCMSCELINAHGSLLSNHLVVITKWNCIVAKDTIATQGFKQPNIQEFTFLEINFAHVHCLNKNTLYRDPAQLWYPKRRDIDEQATCSIIRNVYSISPIFTQVISKQRNVVFLLRIGKSQAVQQQQINNEDLQSDFVMILKESLHLYSLINPERQYLITNLKVSSLREHMINQSMYKVEQVYTSTALTHVYPINDDNEIPLDDANNNNISLISASTQTLDANSCNSSVTGGTSDENYGDEDDEDYTSTSVIEPIKSIVNYVGTITDSLQLEKSLVITIDHAYALYLMHAPIVNYGRSLRIGTRIALHNVHAIAHENHTVHGFLACMNSHVAILNFSTSVENYKFTPIIFELVNWKQLVENVSLLNYIAIHSCYAQCKSKLHEQYLGRDDILLGEFETPTGSSSKKRDRSSIEEKQHPLQHSLVKHLTEKYYKVFYECCGNEGLTKKEFHSEFLHHDQSICNSIQLSQYLPTVIRINDLHTTVNTTKASILVFGMIRANFQPLFNCTMLEIYDVTGSIPIILLSQVNLNDLGGTLWFEEHHEHCHHLFRIVKYNTLHLKEIGHVLLAHKVNWEFKVAVSKTALLDTVTSESQNVTATVLYISPFNNVNQTFSVESRIQQTNSRIHIEFTNSSLLYHSLHVFQTYKFNNLVQGHNKYHFTCAIPMCEQDSDVTNAIVNDQLIQVSQIFHQKIAVDSLITFEGFIVFTEIDQNNKSVITVRDQSNPSMQIKCFYDSKLFPILSHVEFAPMSKMKLHVLFTKWQKRMSKNDLPYAVPLPKVSNVHIINCTVDNSTLEQVDSNSGSTALRDIGNLSIRQIYLMHSPLGAKDAFHIHAAVAEINNIVLQSFVKNNGRTLHVNGLLTIDDGTGQAFVVIRDVFQLYKLLDCSQE